MIGIDIVNIPRFEKIIEGESGERLLHRIFFDEEIDSCRNSEGTIRMESLAARFAAKEAVIKASRGKLDISSLGRIKIIKKPEGFLEAEVSLSGQEVLRFEVSISHDLDMAVAIAEAKYF